MNYGLWIMDYGFDDARNLLTKIEFR